MKKLLLAGTIMGALAIPAYADIILDPLQGVCGGTCADNGNFTPITQLQADTEFGFRIDPAQTVSSLKLVFLAPTALGVNGPISLEELNASTLAVTALLAATSHGTWFSSSTQTLSEFLSLGLVQPHNPFDAFQKGADAGVTSFNVFTVDVGTSLLGTICNCDNPADEFKLLTQFVSNALDVDIVAFAFTANGWVATAPSGQLQISTLAVPGPIVGAGLPGLVTACFSLVGLGWHRRRRQLVA